MILSINDRCKRKYILNFSNVDETEIRNELFRLKKRASQSCDIPANVIIENPSTVNIVMIHPTILTISLFLRVSPSVLSLQK